MFLQNKIHLNESLFNGVDPIKLNIKDLDIQDITLLSAEEADWIPMGYRGPYLSWWWLRSPGSDQNHAAYVFENGSFFLAGGLVDLGGRVRPALIISNLKDFNLPLYYEVQLDNGTKWLIIDDNMLLCNDDSFGYHRFDEKSNNYEKSEIKQYIYEKAKQLGFKNIGFIGATNVNHKNKKKLVVLDESKINEDNQSQLKVNDLIIEDITLLSIEEAEQIPQDYRKFFNFWWLKSPCFEKDMVTFVRSDGSIQPNGINVSFGEGYSRPVLIVPNLNYFNLPLYFEVELDNGTKWLVISNTELLCNDESFGECRFDNFLNDYNNSDIKFYNRDKAKQLGFKNIGEVKSVNHKNKKELKILDESKINGEPIEININDLFIEDITLLSVEEADQLHLTQRIFYGKQWWLKSPSDNAQRIIFVDRYGDIDFAGEQIDIDNCSVRPVLIVSNLKDFNLPYNSHILISNGDISTEWSICDANMLLCCNEYFGCHRFDKESTDYEKSEIRQYIHARANKFGFNFSVRNVNHKNKKKLVVLYEKVM